MLLDIKSWDPETYRRVTKQDIAPTLRFAERLAAMDKPVWVRFVLVPGLTDDPANVEGVARFVAPMKNVEWVEVLPFHQLGAFKWKDLGLDYALADTPPAPPDLIARVHRPVPRCGLQRPITNAPGGIMESIEFVRSLLEQQPLMALFLTIAIGYLVGEINIKGFSLGVGAVLFVALAMGWFAPKAVPAPMVGTLGLALFLYAVGVQYGKQFFIGLISPAGRRANLIALTGVLCGGRGEPAVREADGAQPRSRARPVRRFRHQHADAAGGDRHAWQRRSRRGLLGRLSVRRGRADPVPLHRLHVPQAEDRNARAAAVSKCCEIVAAQS